MPEAELDPERQRLADDGGAWRRWGHETAQLQLLPTLWFRNRRLRRPCPARSPHEPELPLRPLEGPEVRLEGRSLMLVAAGAA